MFQDDSFCVKSPSGRCKQHAMDRGFPDSDSTRTPLDSKTFYDALPRQVHTTPRNAQIMPLAPRVNSPVRATQAVSQIIDADSTTTPPASRKLYDAPPQADSQTGRPDGSTQAGSFQDATPEISPTFQIH
ncbi:hypothetical protein AAVH_29149 [Aphelenchoides avenae]|nr:hypothetical protein AAVH_29148 [Aphelenchus avenae]KAH7703678.1 hypothetical protein AAVH_29149 [Aphelenchus avenae]